MQRQLLQLALLTTAILAVSAIVYAAERASGMLASFPMVSAMLVGLAAAGTAHALGRGGRAGHKTFAAAVGSQIDRMMIGAAETAFFIDSVKKKVELDVASTSAIVSQTQHSAEAMERIAGDAEQASKIAADVRSVSVAGRAEVDRGLARINRARKEAELASGVMTELKVKSREIHAPDCVRLAIRLW